jgi:X-X-X-Leu-X-X-Gly heptad repeat protein
MGALADGVGALTFSVGAVADGVGALISSIGRVADGVGALVFSVGAVADGVGALISSIGKVADGVGDLAFSVGALADGVGALALSIGAVAAVIRSVFEDAYNYMKSGTLMRQVINKINDIDLNKSADRHQPPVRRDRGGRDREELPARLPGPGDGGPVPAADHDRAQARRARGAGVAREARRRAGRRDRGRIGAAVGSVEEVPSGRVVLARRPWGESLIPHRPSYHSGIGVDPRRLPLPRACRGPGAAPGRETSPHTR